MSARFFSNLALAGLMMAVAACDRPSDQRSIAPPPRMQYVRFEYQIAPASPDQVLELNQTLQNGEMIVEEASLDGDGIAWCRYEGTFKTTKAQVNPDLVPLEQTRTPILNAFGHPRSIGFNFIISAYQARNGADLCGSLDRTIQGLEITSSQGSASGTWRPGDQATVVLRPEMGDQYLGKAVEFANFLNGLRLFFDHAVDNVSAHGYIEGRFGFLAVSDDNEFVILARNGEFGLQNQQ